MAAYSAGTARGALPNGHTGSHDTAALHALEQHRPICCNASMPPSAQPRAQQPQSLHNAARLTQQLRPGYSQCWRGLQCAAASSAGAQTDEIYCALRAAAHACYCIGWHSLWASMHCPEGREAVARTSCASSASTRSPRGGMLARRCCAAALYPVWRHCIEQRGACSSPKRKMAQTLASTPVKHIHAETSSGLPAVLGHC